MRFGRNGSVCIGTARTASESFEAELNYAEIAD